MQKSGIVILFIAAFILSACTPQLAKTAAIPPTSIALLPLPTITPSGVPTIALTPTATIVPTAVIPQSGPATCQVVPVVPTPDPTAEVLLPAVNSTDWTYGPDTAAITVIEYGDFQSTASAQLYTVLMSLQKKYPNDLRLVFRQFPLSEQYDKDYLAAQAAEAAGQQGKFWQFANWLYTSQSDWTSKSVDDFTTWAVELAATKGLDSNQFKTDMLADATVNKVTAARSQAVLLIQAGALTTDPFLFFNGAAVFPPYNLDILSGMVDYLELPARAFTTCPPMTVDSSKQYTATIRTEKGDIVIQLYADKAPWAVNSFIFLAEQGWYNNSGFFRVIPGFMAQAGDPSNSGLGNPGYSFSDEFTPDLRFDEPGVVGMANDGQPDTNGSQFFITYAAAPSLDGKYTIFGQVISGMNVLTTLRPRNPASDAILLTPDPILSIIIEVK
jgi:cyclophilin family peptidyl-prolyl cis-trans isomerase/protein-disulfide isomerase